jgi:DNA modification methylase
VITLENFMNRIIYGDCINILGKMPSHSIDLVVADPPYLVNYRSRDGRTYANDIHSSWLKPAFAQVFRVLKADRLCVCFYGWPKAERFLWAWKEAGFYPVSHLVWIKRYCSKHGFTRAQHDCAYVLAKGDPQKPENPISDILEYEFIRNDLHPAQRPVMAITPLIRAFSKIGDTVLDPFAGSGTTAIAARQCRRNYIAIEKVWRYYRLARERLGQVADNPTKVRQSHIQSSTLLVPKENQHEH